MRRSLFFLVTAVLVSVPLAAAAAHCPTAGAAVTWYDTEFFSSELSQETWSTVDWSGARDFDSVIVRGSILPSVTESRELRVTSRPEVEFYFEGTHIGGTLPLAGDCLQRSPTSTSAPVQTLHANRYYSYEIRMRTGCDIYDDSIRLEWAVPPDECTTPGATATWYADENFQDESSQETWSTVEWSGSRLFDSIIIQGSIRPTVTGSYDLRVTSVPEAEFYLEGEKIGGTLSPMGDCLPRSPSSITAADQTLNAGQYYTYEIRLRTGCDIYADSILLEWRELPGGSWETAPASVLWTCLITDVWGTVPAGILRTCSLTGVCDAGWTGEQCDEVAIPVLSPPGVALVTLLLLGAMLLGLRAAARRLAPPP